MAKSPAPPTATEEEVRALLERYRCPVPFHEVRTRFLGNVATPLMSASPIKMVEGLWGGKLPDFSSIDEANELIGALIMGLWNRLTRHQERSTPFRLTWAANASLASMRSRSSIFQPAFLRAAREAGDQDRSWPAGMTERNLKFGSAVAASVCIAVGSMTAVASAVTAEVAKKCETLADKAYPPRVPGNPAAGSATGTAQSKRSYFSKCLANGGNMDDVPPLPPARPEPPRQ
jgi:hypothetical protein